MSAEEFSVWLAEFKVSPWGERRDAIRAAHIAQVIGNYAGKVRKEPIELAEALAALFEETRRVLDPEAVKLEEPDPATFFAGKANT